MHWTFKDDKTRVPQPDEYFGFVYVITNKLTTKQYIGCKQYWQMRKRKKHKPSNWRVYTSSSKDLNEDIDKLGMQMRLRNLRIEGMRRGLRSLVLAWHALAAEAVMTAQQAANEEIEARKTTPFSVLNLSSLRTADEFQKVILRNPKEF